jgi:hypothetical protein
MFDRIIYTESSIRHGGLPVPDPPEPPEMCKTRRYTVECNDCPFCEDCWGGDTDD